MIQVLIGSHSILHLLQMLIRKFKENPGMKTNLSESKVVMDPDLIDLTMIPPPMTPDEGNISEILTYFLT